MARLNVYLCVFSPFECWFVGKKIAHLGRVCTVDRGFFPLDHTQALRHFCHSSSPFWHAQLQAKRWAILLSSKSQTFVSGAQNYFQSSTLSEKLARIGRWFQNDGRGEDLWSKLCLPLILVLSRNLHELLYASFCRLVDYAGRFSSLVTKHLKYTWIIWTQLMYSWVAPIAGWTCCKAR